jgi:hypothetical protein
MIFLEEPPKWQDKAACKSPDIDPAIFFPERGEDQKEVKAICSGCPVKEDCLDYALRNHERNGIWGGTSEKQRVALRRKRRKPTHQRPAPRVIPPEPVEKVLDILYHLEKRFG